MVRPAPGVKLNESMSSEPRQVAGEERVLGDRPGVGELVALVARVVDRGRQLVGFLVAAAAAQLDLRALDRPQDRAGLDDDPKRGGVTAGLARAAGCERELERALLAVGRLAVVESDRRTAVERQRRAAGHRPGVAGGGEGRLDVGRLAAVELEGSGVGDEVVAAELGLVQEALEVEVLVRDLGRVEQRQQHVAQGHVLQARLRQQADELADCRVAALGRRQAAELAPGARAAVEDRRELGGLGVLERVDVEVHLAQQEAGDRRGVRAGAQVHVEQGDRALVIGGKVVARELEVEQGGRRLGRRRSSS